MSNLEFFKNEAKKFLKDWQTQTQTVESDGFISYHYSSKFYDVGDLFFYYELDDKDEQNIKLARAQHYIAKMVGFKKWDDLVHASETELELAELLLRRFKNAQDVQDWEETLMFTGVEQYGKEAVLDYARQYYELGDRKEIVNLPSEKLTILSGKMKSEEFKKFSDENNPDGTLRKSSYVFCTHCNKAFNFTQSKVRLYIPNGEAESEAKRLSNWLDYGKECELWHYEGCSTGHYWRRNETHKQARAKAKSELEKALQEYWSENEEQF